MPAIEVWPWRDKEVVVVDVFPSHSPPHHVRAQGVERGTYVRVGASNRIADENLREKLKRTARNESYDELPVPALSSEAIDFGAAAEPFAPLRQLRRGDLESLRLLTRHQRRLVPTNGGILLFGVQRAAAFPDAWVQVGRFSGTTRTHILEAGEIHSFPAAAIPKAVEFVQKHALRSFRIGVSPSRWTTGPDGYDIPCRP